MRERRLSGLTREQRDRILTVLERRRRLPPMPYVFMRELVESGWVQRDIYTSRWKPTRKALRWWWMLMAIEAIEDSRIAEWIRKRWRR